MRNLLAFVAAFCVAANIAFPTASSADEGLYNFDFRGVSLRGALTAVARREGIKLAPMPTVPDSGSIGVVFSNVRPEQVWASLMRPYHLAFVDDSVTGLRYVGTETEIASEFPSSAVRQVVALTYPGDVSQAGDLTRELADVVGPGTQVFTDRREGTVVVIGTPAAIAQARAIFAAMQSAKPYQSGQYTTAVIPLDHIRVSDAQPVMAAAIGPVQQPNTLAYSPQENAVIASGSLDFIDRVKRLVSGIDIAVPLMKLDVTVVALQPNNDNSNVGVAFGGVTVSGTPIGSTFQTTIFKGSPIQINATLSALVQKGSAAVLSRGALYSRNNVESSIDSVTTYPFVETTGGVSTTTTVQNFDVGATIKMTPTFLSNGMLVNVDASYSTLQGFAANNGPPIIAKNHTKGELVLQDDTALVVSGFYSDVSSDTLQKLPLLGDLPLLGGFFRNHTTSRVRAEIAFIVVPHKGSEQDMVPGDTAPIGMPANYNLHVPVFPTIPAPTPTPVHPLIGPKHDDVQPSSVITPTPADQMLFVTPSPAPTPPPAAMPLTSPSPPQGDSGTEISPSPDTATSGAN